MMSLETCGAKIRCATVAVQALLLLQGLLLVRAQQVSVSIPGLGGKRGRWYVWLIVSIAGAFLIYTAFFVIRGFMIARKRKRAFQQEGVSEEDPVYTTKHEAVLRRLIPSSRMPQGQGTTNFSPMMSQVLAPDWKEHQKAVSTAV